ncbi:MAG: type IV toxin-antitoxin system AbiEi family antitoxin domain-containing protein [Pseudomonadales bacterium]
MPVHLYADQKLPGWAKKIDVGTTLVQHNRQRFLNSLSSDPSQRSETKEQFATDESDPFLQANALREYSQDGYSLIASTPERAILEMLDELPKDESFHAVDMAMESLVDLSPIRVQALLERATSIKVKRLFFFFADRHRHAWLSRIDRHRVDLGSGKRMLVKDGVLDTTYGITVPRDFDRTNKGHSPPKH